MIIHTWSLRKIFTLIFLNNLSTYSIFQWKLKYVYEIKKDKLIVDWFSENTWNKSLMIQKEYLCISGWNTLGHYQKTESLRLRWTCSFWTESYHLRSTFSNIHFILDCCSLHSTFSNLLYCFIKASDGLLSSSFFLHQIPFNSTFMK